MTEMFGEAWSPMSVPDLAPDDDDELRSDALLELIAVPSEVRMRSSRFSLLLADSTPSKEDWM